jgi:hypothetical protein
VCAEVLHDTYLDRIWHILKLDGATLGTRLVEKHSHVLVFGRWPHDGSIDLKPIRSPFLQRQI